MTNQCLRVQTVSIKFIDSNIHMFGWPSFRQRTTVLVLYASLPFPVAFKKKKKKIQMIKYKMREKKLFLLHPMLLEIKKGQFSGKCPYNGQRRCSVTFTFTSYLLLSQVLMIQDLNVLELQYVMLANHNQNLESNFRLLKVCLL